ncbi:MAG TPA: hypothetical protein VIH52_00085 [Candidatus Nanoarchaeia archaeon]|nr:hypothetical protein [uncultured archaeon]
MENSSLLVTGSTQKAREEWARQKANSQSSKFDILEVDAKEQRGIEGVRQVLQALSRQPFEGNLITILVHEADNLTQEAQNALLKVLEEPPTHSQIILCTQTKDNLLPTVVSRCFEVRVDAREDSEKNFSASAFLEESLGSQIDYLEKVDLTTYISGWGTFLNEGLLGGKNLNPNLKWLASYLHLIIKLRKGQKFSLNKKLLAITLALELPSKG